MSVSPTSHTSSQEEEEKEVVVQHVPSGHDIMENHRCELTKVYLTRNEVNLHYQVNRALGFAQWKTVTDEDGDEQTIIPFAFKMVRRLGLPKLVRHPKISAACMQSPNHEDFEDVLKVATNYALARAFKIAEACVCHGKIRDKYGPPEKYLIQAHRKIADQVNTIRYYYNQVTGPIPAETHRGITNPEIFALDTMLDLRHTRENRQPFMAPWTYKTPSFNNEREGW